MDLLRQYFRLQQELYDYFGYEEEWGHIPLRDETDCQWMLDHRSLVWSEEVLTEEAIRDGITIWSLNLRTPTLLKKKLAYAGADYTMVVDGKRDLIVLANAKRCEDEFLMRLYHECWG